MLYSPLIVLSCTSKSLLFNFELTSVFMRITEEPLLYVYVVHHLSKTKRNGFITCFSKVKWMLVEMNQGFS